MSDFSALLDIPQMYRHCKATEDRDMTPFDFITDHLINIDGIFDKHDNGDEQNPHNPPLSQHIQIQVLYLIPLIYPDIKRTLIKGKDIINYTKNYWNSDYISGIFHPPLV